MNRLIHTVVSLLAVVLFGAACNQTAGPNAASVARGKALFDDRCSGCHNFLQDGIGPSLAGVTKTAPDDWLRRFIKNPSAMIEAADPKARELLAQYKLLMPSFAALHDTDLTNLLAYLHTRPASTTTRTKDAGAITNPVPEPIPSSGIVAALQLVAEMPHSASELPFTRIAKLEAAPGSNALFVLDQRGLLYSLAGGKPVVYLDMGKWKTSFINAPGLGTGFGSFAFHPDFAHNGLFYTTHTEKARSKKADFSYADSIPVALQWVVTEWHSSATNAAPFSGTSRELLRINMVSAIHGVQELAFNPRAKKGQDDYGLLYIGVGDGGCVENGVGFLAHDPHRVWGTILRIDPAGRNSANGQYGLPSSNPFYQSPDTTMLREIYAYGFRNPNRLSWTRDGRLLATNIGQANLETVNLVLKGGDYGWPLREGSFAVHPAADINFVYPLSQADAAQPITGPVAQYDHDEGKAISGGFEYDRNDIAGLQHNYLFGDVPTGRLFYVDAQSLTPGHAAVVKEWHVSYNGKKETLRALCGSDRVDLHFGQDHNGAIYLLTKPDGKIYKLIAEKKAALR